MQLSLITLRQFNCKHFFRNILKQITKNLLRRMHMGYPGAGVVQPPPWCQKQVPAWSLSSLPVCCSPPLRTGATARRTTLTASAPAEPRQTLLARSQFYQHKRSRNPMMNQTRLFWVTANPSTDLQFSQLNL